MATLNIEIPEQLERFVSAGVQSGRFPNASEAVAEGLRDLQVREDEYRAKVEWLAHALQEGLDDIEAGRCVVLRSRADIDAHFDKLWESASAGGVDDFETDYAESEYDAA
jgi:antitoxin ParD1/3/4